ncbi:MAG: ribosome maturation factor RimP [Ruminococcus sp.]|nr:ribosome maturation factor RimP [Candidatus Apopatosoma intestinale]
MAKENIASFVEEKLSPAINGIGYDVWDVEYVKEGADYYLRFTIDSPDGITLDDCEKVSRLIDPLLDELDPIEDAYHLEVSSPGVERVLRKPAHFEAMIGETIEIRLFRPDASGKKAYTGTLAAFSDGTVRLDTDGGTVSVAFADVAKSNTVFDFTDIS